MKNKFITFVLIVTMGIMMIPPSTVEARPQNGLIRGVLPNGTTGFVNGTMANLTDGNDGTGLTFGVAATATWNITPARNITGVYLYDASETLGTSEMRIYAEATLVGTTISSNIASASYTSVSYAGVTRIVIVNVSDANIAIREVDIRELTETIPPANPVNLTVGSQTNMTANISFKTPTDSDYDKYKIYIDNVLQFTSPSNRSKDTFYNYTLTGLTNGLHTVKVTSMDVNENESAGVSVDFTTDQTPPANVSGLGVLNATTSSVTISFTTPNTADFDRYKIYRDNLLINTSTVGRAKNTAYTYVDTGRPQGTSYTYKVTTMDAMTNESAGVSVVGTVLAIPAIPTGLIGTAGVVGSGEIFLEWNENSPVNLLGYEVYRGAVRINNDLVIGETYTDAGLAYGSYGYRIRAVNASGIQSAFSATVNVTLLPPPDQTPPAVPILTANPGNTKVQLLWTGNTETDLAGYNLYRDGVKINTGLLTGSTYMDEGLENFQTYSYTITAVDTTGNASDHSAAVDAMPEDPDETPPAAPTGLNGVSDDNIVELSWLANGEYDLAGYNVYRDGVKVNTDLLTDNAYTDLGVTNNITYSYRLTAVDTTGNESSLSMSLAATPQGEITPKNVKANSGTNRMIVTWEPVFNAAEYYVYRDGDLIATITGTQFIDEDVIKNGSYTYNVVSLVDGVLSDQSLPTTGTVGQVIEFPNSAEGLPGIIAVVFSAFSFAGLFAPYLVLILSLMLVTLLIAFVVWLVSKVRKKREWEKIKQAELRDLKNPVIIARMKAARERAAGMETAMIERNNRSERSKADRRGTKKLSNREWEKVKQAELTDQKNPVIAARVDLTRKELNRATTTRSGRDERISRTERSGRNGRK